MKKETERRSFGLKPIVLIIELILAIFLVLGMAHCLYNLPMASTTYPEETYKILEETVHNVFVDDKYIDIERLEKQNLEYNITYKISYNESDSSWGIELKKENESINATIIRSSDDTLLVERIERNKTQEEYSQQIKEFEGFKKAVIIICIVVSTVFFLGIIIVIFFSFKKKNP